MFELLADDGIHSWQLQITVPHGNAADHPEIILQPYMYSRSETPTGGSTAARPAACGCGRATTLGYFGPIERRLRASQSKHWRGCTAGCPGSASRATADQELPEPRRREQRRRHWAARAQEAWEETYQLGYIRGRTVDDLWGYCRDCYYAETRMAAALPPPSRCSVAPATTRFATTAR
ncbi:MAG: hypothetical protein IPO88_20630 [Nannocystis sp.]|uniref:hypothetical protein n=1 Tax=Nannocystis sp. TaxID=1962667 RepID=UPI00242515B3|nr:hypothetical protein [Nannocystis sp.]MBK9755863.1 hypothetical protein [Nannocystis sp.]